MSPLLVFGLLRGLRLDLLAQLSVSRAKNVRKLKRQITALEHVMPFVAPGPADIMTPKARYVTEAEYEIQREKARVSLGDKKEEVISDDGEKAFKRRIKLIKKRDNILKRLADAKSVRDIDNIARWENAFASVKEELWVAER